MTAFAPSLLGSIALLAVSATPFSLPATSPTSSAPESQGASAIEGDAIPGEQLSPAMFGRSWVESMEEVVRRDRANPTSPGIRLIPEPENPWEERIEREKELAELQGQDDTSGQQNLGGGGSAPTVGTNFVGPAVGGPGGGWVPPDTCGAAGINHFVSVTNSNISVWNKTTGVRQLNVGQPSFWGIGGSLGDGRAVFDPHSQRFILLTEDFSSRVYIAVSTTSDPMGTWFKTSFVVSAGTDAGHWPDYPTLGVDANGIYTAAYMVGGPNTMSIFAIDKAPLIAGSPSLGTVTAFRGRPWEGAIHPCVTYGNPGAEYLVSRVSGSQLRVVRVNPPLTAPTITIANTNFSTGVSTSAPPDAPQSGGGLVPTLDGRLMNAVYRNGTVWTGHAVNVGGRSGCRWYSINPTLPPTTAQTGSVDDPSLAYYFPGISVNANGDMLVGFSGSNASQFPGVYVSGRKFTDAAGQTAPPILVKPGETANNDGRFGDYSLTSIDPTDDLTFWTIQEYGRGGSWGTWITEAQFDTCAITAPGNFCITSPNTAGPGATMTSLGSTRISPNDFVLQAFGLPPNKACIFFYGMDQTAFAPLGNGTRCIGSPFFRLPLTQSNLFGDAELALDLNNLPNNGDIQAGESWGFQCWYRDPQAPGATTNVSDGLTTSWCP